MNIILKSVLVIKSVVFVTSHIQDIFPNIISKRNNFYFCWNKTISKTTMCINVRSGWLEKIQLGSLAYGIVTVRGRVTCITNEVISSRHDSVFEVYFCELVFQSDWLIAKRIRSTVNCILTILVSTKNCILHRNLAACLHT